MLSPLQLKNLAFEKVCLEVQPSGTFEAMPQLRQNLETAIVDADQRIYRLDLDLEIKIDPEKPFAYSGEVSAVGVFEVSPDFPDERLLQLVQVNGGSILYGAIRDMVLTISGRSLKGGFLLPTLNFQEVLKASTIATPVTGPGNLAVQQTKK